MACIPWYGCLCNNGGILVFDFYQLTRDLNGVMNRERCKCNRMIIGADGLEALWPPVGLHGDVSTKGSIASVNTNSSHTFTALQSIPAAQFIDLGLSWVEQLLDDATRFPTRSSTPFPVDFVEKSVRPCVYILYALLAHAIYVHYQDKIVSIDMQAHANTLFMHIYSFSCAHKLIDEDTLTGLSPLFQALARIK